MKNKLLIVGVSIVFLFLLIYVIYLHSKIPKIAFVRTGILVEKFKGMGEARKELEKKMGKWQANIDTLEMNYQKSVDGYNNRYARLGAKERMELKTMLDKQEQALSEYVRNIEGQAQQENLKLTKGVLGQINTFIKKYSEDNKYTMIFGVTSEGNILYGTDAVDLTEEILVEINKEYSGK